MTTLKAGSDPRLSYSRELSRTWQDAVASVNRARVANALNDHNYEGAIDAIMGHIEMVMGDALAHMYIGSARQFAQKVAIWTGQPTSFNPTTLPAMRDAADLRHYMIEDLRGYREALRAVILQGLSENRTTGYITDTVLGAIGLTTRDLAAVQNYATALATNDTATTLGTELRDRRLDAAVRRGTLTAEQSRRLVSSKINLLRTTTLARLLRTQTQRAVNAGEYGLLMQLRDNLRIGGVRRTWHSKSKEGRAGRHGGMNGQVRDLETPFTTPKGAQIRYPGDPRAGADETINCQCYLTYSF